MKKLLLFALFAVISVNLKATVYVVACGTWTNVTCVIGDTIRFKNYANQNTLITIQTTTGNVWITSAGTRTTVLTASTAITPDGSGKLVDYVMVGDEIQYQLNYGTSSQTGTFTFLSTGIEDTNFSSSNVLVYPNPCNMELRLSTPVELSADIYNVSGQIVKSQRMSIGMNSINTESLVPGLYLISLGNKKLRFVKE